VTSIIGLDFCFFSIFFFPIHLAHVFTVKNRSTFRSHASD